MQKKFTVLVALTVTALCAASAFAASGEEIFKAKCAACHPDGETPMKPKETLKGKKSPEKIIKKIRKGAHEMPAFSTKEISDADAKLLADYIISTFKK